MSHHALKILTFVVAVLMLTAFTAVTLAVDGVILIDQNRAVAGNVTPGDTPGFPVEINIPGSYRLSANLSVGTGASAGIKINSGNVTIDLNGFTIIGAGTINAPDIGIDGQGVGGITVINGNIFNSSANGIWLGDLAKVENVRVTNTVQFEGIIVGDNSIVHGNLSYGNATFGIVAGSHSLITGNTANHNGLDGFLVHVGSTVSGNTANENGAAGISALTDNTISGNTASFNRGSGIKTSGTSTVTGNTATSNSLLGLDVQCPSSVVGNMGSYLLRGSGCVNDHNAI